MLLRLLVPFCLEEANGLDDFDFLGVDDLGLLATIFFHFKVEGLGCKMKVWPQVGSAEQVVLKEELQDKVKELSL